MKLKKPVEKAIQTVAAVALLLSVSSVSVSALIISFSIFMLACYILSRWGRPC